MNHSKAERTLSKIYQLDCEINRLIEEKQAYEDLAEKTTQSFTTAPVRSNTTDKIAELSAKIVDTENEICSKIDELICKKNAISQQMEKIREKDYKRVLTLRYIRFMQFSKIAEKMGYSQRTIFRIYRKALKEFEIILSESDKK